MDTKPLKKIVEELQAGKPCGYIVMCRVLSAGVLLTQLWPDYKVGDVISSDLSPRIVYLIQVEGQVVGGVEPLEDNLTAFMLPAWRGKGVFSKAMKETVLVHILQSRPLQRLQLLRAEHGERKAQLLKKIALSLGFILLKDDADIRLVIDVSKRPVGRFVAGEDQQLPAEKKVAIQEELSLIAYRLTLIRSELELTEGVSYFSDALGDTIRSLQNS